MEIYYTTRGKKIYTEILGQDKAKVILFVHGGPGGIGVADFIKYQGENLSKNFRIIAPEQRGVWRSEEILEYENISLEDIIEDFEELTFDFSLSERSMLKAAAERLKKIGKVQLADNYKSALKEVKDYIKELKSMKWLFVISLVIT